MLDNERRRKQSYWPMPERDTGAAGIYPKPSLIRLGALGRPQSFVSKIESGERSLHLSEIFDYAHALDVSIGRLMRDIDAALS